MRERLTTVIHKEYREMITDKLSLPVWDYENFMNSISVAHSVQKNLHNKAINTLTQFLQK
jgi:hypothetical protein